MALGAEAEQVRKMVMIQGMRLAVIGVAVGLVAAFALTRLMASFLFGVQARDPIVFVAMPVLLTIVSIVAVAAGAPGECREPAGRAALRVKM